ncbi:MAG: hypothetical protein ACHQZR_05430 [Candidatus Limnocylindrales bacterium]
MLKGLVDRTHTALRATPVLRRAAPSLAATWHAVDRTAALYEARRLTWQATHDRRRRYRLRLAFTPEMPRYFTSAYQLCVRFNIDIVAPAAADVTLVWADRTVRDEPPPGLDPKAINVRVRDISKRHVDELHRQVFGYDLRPDPSATEFAEKSDANATHDGRVVARPSCDPAVVVQRLIDNRLDEHIVIDHRVALMDGRIVLCAGRYRPLTDRFMGSGKNLLAVLHPPDVYFSPLEQRHMAAMCEAAGADWAELDVLRDRASGRLFVVDVNPTPGGPISSLPPADLAEYWRLQEVGFAALLLAHAR